MRILIIHTAFIGDIVLSTPLIQRLKDMYPNSKIDYLTLPSNKTILSNNPNLNEKLKQENSDTVAWLKVENTNIEIPVVQAKDNSYYLTHNFNKKYNVAGWVFADYKN